MNETKIPDGITESEIKIANIIKPKSTTEYLKEYYETLGDGTLNFIGVETGFQKLDKATLGLDGLIVLGGIAGKGKTSLALQLAFGVCEKDTPVLFYSLEMPRRAIYTKILNRLSEIRYSDILLKGKTLMENSNFKKAQSMLEGVGDKLYVFDKTDGEATTEKMEQDINMIKAEHNIDKVFVVVDHLQIMPLLVYKDLKDKIDKSMTALKGINDRTSATILVISQKNRSGYYNSGLESLMGSAGIEYTADIVMFLDTKEEKESRKNKNVKNNDSFIDEVINTFDGSILEPIDLVIRKNRYNAPTLIKFDFNGSYSSFTEKQDEYN